MTESSTTATAVAATPMAPATPAASAATAATRHTPATADEAPALASFVEEDLLVEDISIDGMCGVY